MPSVVPLLATSIECQKDQFSNLHSHPLLPVKLHFHLRAQFLELQFSMFSFLLLRRHTWDEGKQLEIAFYNFYHTCLPVELHFYLRADEFIELQRSMIAFLLDQGDK